LQTKNRSKTAEAQRRDGGVHNTSTHKKRHDSTKLTRGGLTQNAKVSANQSILVAQALAPLRNAQKQVYITTAWF